MTSMLDSNRLFNTATRRYMAAGAAFGFLFPIVATGISILSNQLPFNLASVLQVQRAQPLLWIIDSAPFFLGLFASFAGRREDALQQTNGRLHELSEELEERITQRTGEIERRVMQMTTGAEISRIVSQVLEPDELLRHVVELIRERFGLYYVAVFLLDDAGQNAVLRAATGTVGQVLLEHGHKLEVGGNSMVGWACAHKQARIALDVGAEAIRLANPLLPDTRSEMALPLRTGECAIGALDIQSVHAQAFDEGDITALQGMADQIAVVLENARLFQQVQSSLREVERTNRLLTRQSWETFLHTAPTDFAEFHRASATPFTPEDVERLTLSHSRPDQDNQVCVPLNVRGQAIGTLVVERAAGQPGWSAADLGLLEEMAAQAAQAMESVRLFDESQRRAAREQVINEVTARMRESLDTETVLKTTMEEMYRVFNLAEAEVRMGTSPVPSQAETL